jgi:hypothetical protein
MLLVQVPVRTSTLIFETSCFVDVIGILEAAITASRCGVLLAMGMCV